MSTVDVPVTLKTIFLTGNTSLSTKVPVSFLKVYIYIYIFFALTYTVEAGIFVEDIISLFSLAT